MMEEEEEVNTEVDGEMPEESEVVFEMEIVLFILVKAEVDSISQEFIKPKNSLVEPAK